MSLLQPRSARVTIEELHTVGIEGNRSADQAAHTASAHIPNLEEASRGQLHTLHYGVAESRELAEIITAETTAEAERLSIKFAESDPNIPGVKGRVTILQELINSSGLAAAGQVAVDGVFLEELRIAVNKAQGAMGIGRTHNGEAGPRTIAGLTANALSSGNLRFSDEELQGRWSTAAPLLHALTSSRVELVLEGAPELIHARVKAVQSILHGAGYDVGEIDGVSGPRFRSALEQFRADSGLPQNDAIGPRTLRALLAAYLCR